MKEIGYNPVADSKLEERIVAQEYLLKRYEENVSSINKQFITDRTPLDFIGYTLGEVGMYSSQELSDRIDHFVDRCVLSTQKMFSGVIVCGFLPVYEKAEDKPPENIAYQRHVQMIIDGALEAAGNGTLVRGRLKETNLEKRVDIVESFIAAIRQNLAEEYASQILH